MIKVHPLSEHPTAVWDQIKKNQKFAKLSAKNPTDVVQSNMLRIVCMSDTHSLTSRLQMEIPDGDVFIHAGDFTRCGLLQEVQEFNCWLDSLPHKYKVVIAGNHELSFDPKFSENPRSTKHAHKAAHTGGGIINEIPDLGYPREEMHAAVEMKNAASHLTNAIYLQDESVKICGIKFYGTPWQPEFCNWAFNLPRGNACLNKWNCIPSDTDILVSHSPPLGHGDLCVTGVRAGCVELLTTVQLRVKPKYHVFGHIHEGYGITTDGHTVFINSATCNINYSPVNPPIVFDIPLPSGVTKC